MLLGCCHCGETPPPSDSSNPPSDSTPPPSEPPSSESVDSNGPCNACAGGIVPLKMQVTLTRVAGSFFTSCSADYTGTFKLDFTSVPLSPLPGANAPFFSNASNGCLFYSAELAMRWSGSPICGLSANPSGRRFRLQLVRTNLGGSYRYAAVLYVQWYVGTTGSEIGYEFTRDDIALPGDNALACFGGMTLTTGESNLTLTQTGLPRTLVIGPG
jgi:hypothetical protein